MTPFSQRDEDYLLHMAQAARKAVSYVRGLDLGGFLASELVQDGVIRNLIVIGEAATKLDKAFRASHPDLPWGDITGSRKFLTFVLPGYKNQPPQAAAAALRRAGAECNYILLLVISRA